MGEPKKHHYIPVFYLKRWANADGKIWKFTKPWKGQVRAKPVGPKATGYMENLYRSPGLTPEEEQAFEREFMSPLDSAAATFLEKLHHGNTTWTVRELTAWARFLNSLLMRTPEDYALLKAAIIKDWPIPSEATDAESYQAVKSVLAAMKPEEIEGSAIHIIRRLFDNASVNQILIRMKWSTVDTSTARHELLTSDRPYIMTNGLNTPGSYLMLPAGPRRLFVATPDEITRNQLAQIALNQLVADVNNTVVSHAIKYVYGSNPSQTRFIENRMSSKRAPSVVRAMLSHEPRLVGSNS